MSSGKRFEKSNKKILDSFEKEGTFSENVCRTIQAMILGRCSGGGGYPGEETDRC
jgi:hypothetical protein